MIFSRSLTIETALRSISLFSLLLTGFTGVAAATSFHNPQIYYNTTTDQATFTVQNQTPLDNPRLKISSLYSGWDSQNLTYTGSNSTYATNVSFNRPNGIYFYRFVSEQGSFPENHFTFVAGSYNNSVLLKGLKFQNQNSSYDGCNLVDDFDCNYENYQAERMISAVQFYKATGNITYLERALNFSSKPYGSGVPYRCETFNCDTEVGRGIYSSVRQGALIEGLWTVYGVSDNQTVRELAVNYSQGHPQESCNVWNSSYNCSSGWGQGRMAMGYLTAYRVSGNTTYRTKARKLLRYEYDHPLFGKALVEAYKITGNDSYRKRARELARNISCANCSSNFMKKEFYWSGFLATAEYGYYRNAYQEMNGTCLSNANATCDYPINQSRASKFLLEKYLAFQNKSKDIFDGRVAEKESIGDPVRLTVEYQGMVKNTSLMFRPVGGNWTRCDLGWFGDCMVSENRSLEQGIYEYRFKTQNLSFPKNGTLRFALNSRNTELLEETNDFAEIGMETLPDGEYCDLSDDPLACDNEGYQAKMLSGYSQIYSDTGNYTSRVYELFYGPYVDFKGAEALCDPVDGDYACEVGGYGTESSERTGSYKQGNLIESMWETYRATRNGTVYERAVNYTRGSASDCDVWTGDFNCDSSKGQAAMINGYTEAYLVTGNTTYRNIARNLSVKALESQGGKVLTGALWRSSVLYSNTNFTEQARNWTQDYFGTCVGGGCEPDEFTSSLSFAHDAFVYGDNESYTDYYQQLVDNTTVSGTCGPWKEDYSCSAPDTQGMFMETLQTAAYAVPMNLKTVDSFNASSTSLSLQQSTSLACSTKNVLQNTTVENTTFSLSYPSQAFSLSGNQSQYVGDIPYQNSSKASWTLTAEESGTYTVSCMISSVNGLDKSEEVQITVAEPKKKSTSDRESTGTKQEESGGGWVILPDPEPKPKFINYSVEDFRRFNVSNYGLDLENYTYRRVSCGSATRTVWPSNSTLEVRYCGNLTPVLLIDSANQTVTQVFNNSVEIFFNYSRNISNYSSPLLMEREIEQLSMNSSIGSINVGGNGSVLVISDTSRPVTCSVYRNGEKIYSRFTSELSYRADLVAGENNLRVKCGNSSRSYSVGYSPKISNEGEGMNRFLAAAFIGLLIVSLVFRGSIFSVKNTLLFRFYSRRFRQSIYQENPAEAIEYYNQMKDYSQHVSEDLFYSEIDLMRGVQLYLAMDLLKEGIEDDIVDAFGANIEQIVNRFIEGSDNEYLQRMLNQKLEEIKGQI